MARDGRNPAGDARERRAPRGAPAPAAAQQGCMVQDAWTRGPLSLAVAPEARRYATSREPTRHLHECGCIIREGPTGNYCGFGLSHKQVDADGVVDRIFQKV